MKASAFSLVEVVLSLGIACFGILAIVALLPMGLNSSKDAIEKSSALNILSQIVTDRKATPLDETSIHYQLPAFTGTSALSGTVIGSFGVSEKSPFTTSEFTQSRYRIDYCVVSSAPGMLNPYQLYLKASWPALGNSSTGSVEIIATIPQP